MQRIFCISATALTLSLAAGPKVRVQLHLAPLRSTRCPAGTFNQQIGRF